MNINRVAASSILALGLLLTGGCATGTTQAAASRADAQLVPSDDLVLDQPAVREAVGTLHVTGGLRQQDFSPLRSTGHVHVQVIDDAGGILTSTQARFSTPRGRTTPRTPHARSASYHAHIPGPLPEGSALRVEVCTQDHRSADILE